MRTFALISLAGAMAAYLDEVLLLRASRQGKRTVQPRAFFNIF